MCGERETNSDGVMVWVEFNGWVAFDSSLARPAGKGDVKWSLTEGISCKERCRCACNVSRDQRVCFLVGCGVGGRVRRADHRSPTPTHSIVFCRAYAHCFVSCVCWSTCWKSALVSCVFLSYVRCCLVDSRRAQRKRKGFVAKGCNGVCSCCRGG